MARGPAYPYINLADAVSLVRQLYDYTKRAPANLNAVLKDKWSLSPTSSSSVKIVAALKYYGLVESSGGGKEPEGIRITDRAYRILVDSLESPERKKALRDACLSPRAYKLCWDTWGAEVPESARSTLIFSHGFNEATVGGFLTNYKKSVDFAGLMDADGYEKRDIERQSVETGAIEVGDLVRWHRSGVSGLPAVQRVLRFSEDNALAWIDGHSAGVPLSELAKVDPAVAPTPQPGGLAVLAPERDDSPRPSARVVPPKAAGMRQEIFSLAEGDVMIQWPERMSEDSFQDFTDWLTILQRKIKRSVAPGSTQE